MTFFNGIEAVSSYINVLGQNSVTKRDISGPQRRLKRPQRDQTRQQPREAGEGRGEFCRSAAPQAYRACRSGA